MEENAGNTNSSLCIARSSLHDSGTLVRLTFPLIELDLLTLAPPTNPLLDLRVRIGFVVLGGFDYEAVAISRRPQLKGPRSLSPDFGLHWKPRTSGNTQTGGMIGQRRGFWERENNLR